MRITVSGIYTGDGSNSEEVKMFPPAPPISTSGKIFRMGPFPKSAAKWKAWRPLTLFAGDGFRNKLEESLKRRKMRFKVDVFLL